MKKLLNTLYITSNDLYLSVENSNVLIWRDRKEIQRFPLHTLQSIVTSSRKGVSFPLITECVRQDIPIFYMTEKGLPLAKISGTNAGSIELRRQQFRLSDNEKTSIPFAKAFLNGKLQNSKHTLERAAWGSDNDRQRSRLTYASQKISTLDKQINATDSMEQLRGIEGDAARIYFSVFQDLILNQQDFIFHGRSRRPPQDEVNALLSFAYTLLNNECIAALESVGLDASFGFMHEDHSGRYSLACDLIEEMRSSIADRFVLSLINNRSVKPHHFDRKPEGSCYLNLDGKKIFLTQWQKYKQEEIFHPALQEKISLGMIPFAQSIILSRVVRGEEQTYIPFFRK